jgi:hypothetical protein
MMRASKRLNQIPRQKEEMNLCEHLHRSFEKAENEDSKINNDILSIKGMTGVMTRHFYNNLVSMPGARYLEIGTWMGSSTCAAMYGNSAEIVCVDNWSEFLEGREVKHVFLENLEKFKGDNRIQFIESDCFQVNVKELQKFNIYLYDGPHQVIDHYLALKHYYDCLDDEFIYICDDWDWAAVRQGTIQAIEELGLEVVTFVERSLIEGDTWKPAGYAWATWWNGMWAAVLRKSQKK